MKLDYKKTFKIGLAFMGVMLFWQVYDFAMPLLLTRTYGMNASNRGLVMGIDNMLALFLLPFFGALSDKSKSRLGRRTIFILIGTITAAILFIVIGIIEHIEFTKLVDNGLKNAAEVINKTGHAESLSKQATAILNNQTMMDSVNNEAIKSVLERISSGNFLYEDFMTIRAKMSKFPEIYQLSVQFHDAQVAYAYTFTKANPTSLALFMLTLLSLLIAMGSYRTPAVALMPDATSKPLRSTANAIINFSGGVGAAIAMLLYSVLAKKQDKTFIWLFVATSAGMMIVLALYLIFVKENKFVEMRRQQEEMAGYIDEEEDQSEVKLPRAKFISLILILSTVLLWFFGFNAMSSHFSPYAINKLGFTSGHIGMINLANGLGGAIGLVPVALLSKKFGRKKTIILGLVVTVAAFIGMFFVTSANRWWLAVCFLLAGFGLIMVNVNTLPMAVELSTGKNVGKFTGYYYVFSMTAQSVTPYFAGILMERKGEKWMFMYGAFFIALAILTLLFIKHGDVRKTSEPVEEQRIFY